MDASLQMSALQLEGYYVTELTFKVRPLPAAPNFRLQGGIGVQHDGIYEAEPLTINVQAGAVQHPTEPHRWQNILTVASHTPEDRKYPYDFQITLIGYFIVADVVPAEQREAFVKINAASILYSAARELLATVTGRGPLPAAVLPTVVFTVTPEPEKPPEVMEDTEAEAKKTKKKATKKRATKKSGGKKQQR
jgi:preprotein translocase subunit SecB